MRICSASELSTLWGGTFHSIGNRVLRRHAPLLGYQRDFSIMDREDAKDLLRLCIDEMEIDLKETRFPKADVLGDIFSLASNKEQTIPETLLEQFPYFSHARRTDQRGAYKCIRRERNRRTRWTSTTCSVLWGRLLKDNRKFAEDYQRRFQFVLVDEYQDTNKIQGEFIDLLAARHQNIMAVGDDSQSIYSWRGAQFSKHRQISRALSQGAGLRIETNYRSTPEILEVANAAIAANTNQFPKHLNSARKPGMKPVLVMCESGDQQAAFIAQRMLELRDEGVSLQKYGGALSRAFPRVGTADGTDAAQYSIQHYERHPVF